ncbi:hypothetical protein BGZ96_000222 [Linnemannia gamsii]|uniref:Uncharacterized protein n=1 Tax=Linnemannia gamsii TaxID=64522 RepID=A0ABQ7KA50_9FUNG|nr:hypothetical protein BGZ96_000222 [Linnemannia gamsii]
MDDLIEMGYFDDYDSEMGWDYRDESLDDDFSVAMDSDEEDEEDDLGSEKEEEEEEEEELEREEEEDGRFEHSFGQRVFERSTFDEDQEEEDDEVESSVADVESSIAEDEFLHRLASDPFLGNGGSDNDHHVCFTTIAHDLAFVALTIPMVAPRQPV